MIKAIDTRYGGFLFRSRLEARWAVFFDKLGLKWEYEPQGFDIDGVWYLPDFRVLTPQGEPIWYEIKPSGVKSDPKFEAFAKNVKRSELLSGDPLDVLSRADICPRCGQIHEGQKMWSSFRWRDSYMVSCYYCDFETPWGDDLEETGFMGVWILNHEGTVIVPLEDWENLEDRRLFPAAKFAREARFEHGATPQVRDEVAEMRALGLWGRS